MTATRSNERSEVWSRYGGWAFIAGASAGLGAAFAREAGRLGFDVVLLARRAEVLEATAADIAAEHGVQTRCIAADLARDDIADVVAAATADLDVGVFVYNAAAELYGPFLNLSPESHRTNLAVNCFTPTVLSEHFGARMRDRGRGAIALVSSLAALQGARYLTTYAASKAYELILAEGLWEEYADHGVDALAYVVGATVSESWRGAGTDAFQDDQELSPLQARILAPATSADVAARLYTVLGDGPRQYSNLTDEQASLESAAKPRAEVVHAMADVTVNLERFSHLPKPPRYRT
ncbi:MAG: SDR family NAD(P)-dependent oxidoreductase [Acidimicrobiales bacterium]|nr:SDR family NAD(P)-dependent oxidoreductase [Acidimicrobiales bacterium]